jgi:hypothetical protein
LQAIGWFEGVCRYRARLASDRLPDGV